jgi:hypothetical protein
MVTRGAVEEGEGFEQLGRQSLGGIPELEAQQLAGFGVEIAQAPVVTL